MMNYQECLRKEICQTSTRAASALASELPTAVLPADYRLAPEHHLPAALDDAATVLSWVRSQAAAVGDADPWIAESDDFSRVFVSGDSAGGNIVHHVAAVRLGSGQLSFDPAQFDGVRRTVSEAEYPPCPFLTLPWSFGPESSALDGVALPPMLVVVAEHDLLRDRNADYVARLKGMGKPVEFQGQHHGFYAVEPSGGVETTQKISEFQIYMDFWFCFRVLSQYEKSSTISAFLLEPSRFPSPGTAFPKAATAMFVSAPRRVEARRPSPPTVPRCFAPRAKAAPGTATTRATSPRHQYGNGLPPSRVSTALPRPMATSRLAVVSSSPRLAVPTHALAPVRPARHRGAAIPHPCRHCPAPFMPRHPPCCHAPCVPRLATAVPPHPGYKSHPILSQRHRQHSLNLSPTAIRHQRRPIARIPAAFIFFPDKPRGSDFDDQAPENVG